MTVNFQYGTFGDDYPSDNEGLAPPNPKKYVNTATFGNKPL